MAAVTVEDCLKIIPNRFELSLIASYRVKQLMNGAPILYVPEKQEKNTVVALREIATGLLDLNAIREDIKNNIKSHTLFKNFDENIIYDSKKGFNSELEEANLNDETSDNFDDSNLDDEILEDDDEEYYKNIDDSALEEADDVLDRQ